MTDLLKELMTLNKNCRVWRFGLSHFNIYTYLDIVVNYASIRKIPVKQEMLRQKAIHWSLSHGSYSGRTARQFIDDLEGQLGSRK
jgi:hypothetical protein